MQMDLNTSTPLSKLDLDHAGVWDKWRSLYSVMSSEDHREFYNRVAAKYPNQEHHDTSLFLNLFKSIHPGARVVEVGGWKGELAKKCLAEFMIKSWTNYEFCEDACRQSVCTDWRYQAYAPDAFDWFKSRDLSSFDVFVSAHTIEHLSDSHLTELLHSLKSVPVVMLEAPICIHGNDWAGYPGTHILRMGWAAINTIMCGYGYGIERLTDICYLYRKEEFKLL
jgi:hypothetical protein